MGATAQNLARSLRPTTFDTIVGQSMTIRVLKNSLYKAQLFPVYLFSGQRGCGKTTTARVFATAVNCLRLHEFRTDPRSVAVPCYACDQCKAMRSGAHPDFFEIDAASNTGVEHVRGIMEACSLYPVMGGKKVYLIDEVHMLSKSAFNALLKLLEEPPESVLFILATTDPEKIPETVRSRCFVLPFNPIDVPTLLRYLASICDAQHIRYQVEGLEVIARCASGSARDAINLLERVRFASTEVTPGAVHAVLGHVDDEVIVTILDAVARVDGASLASQLHHLREKGASCVYVWARLKECVRALLWLAYSANVHDFIEYKQQMRRLVALFGSVRLSMLVQLFCMYELPFRRSADQFLFLEILLLRTCLQKMSGSDSDLTPSTPAVTSAQAEEQSETEPEGVHEDDASEEGTLEERFFSKLRSLDDPLIASIVDQVVSSRVSQDKKGIHLIFPENMKFFAELLGQTHKTWAGVVVELCGNRDALTWEFTAEPKKTKKVPIRSSDAQQSAGVMVLPDRVSKKAPAAPYGASPSVRKSRHQRGGGVTLHNIFDLHNYKLQQLSSQAIKLNTKLRDLLTAVPGILYTIERVGNG